MFDTVTIVVRIGAAHDEVTVTDRGRVTTFDRSTMDRPARNKLRRMLVDACVKAGKVVRRNPHNRRKT